jgi:hypothetical protein
MKYCVASYKKLRTVPDELINAHRYRLCLYKDLLLRQSNK